MGSRPFAWLGTAAGTPVSVNAATVAIADRVKPVNTLDARVRIDRLAGALGGCRCARATP